MKSKIVYALFFLYFYSPAIGQELVAKVTVNANKVNTTVDKKIFITLQNQLTNFLSTRKWTTDQFAANERIACNFLLNIESSSELNVYKASLIVQAARPVYASSYQTALINYQDADFTFKYVQFQPVEFNDNRIQGTDPLVANLTATFAFYAYTILGLDYDSFSPKGGDIYFQKALNIINNAPESSGISGWKLFDGLRNRYWLNENLINTRYNIIHDVLYSYYRTGLDKLQEKEVDARLNIIQTLTQLLAFNRENANTMFVQFFLQNRMVELIGIFKKGSLEEKTKVLEILTKLDASNAQRYKDELK